MLPLDSPQNKKSETSLRWAADVPDAENLSLPGLGRTFSHAEAHDGGDTIITLCVCAMCRTREKASVRSLIDRLEARGITVISLDETILFDDDVYQSFPRCDAIWTLYSPDLPLNKVESYIERVGCMELNSIAGLVALRDRREMYRILVENEIPVPFHVVCNRKEEADHPDNCVIEEFDDYIVVDGQKLSKPFLEKPADADNHEVYIYYPKSVGGGRTRLGKNMCGFDERGRIRRHGSFVYERFIPSEGFETRLFVISSTACEKENTYIFAEAKTSIPATASVDDSRQIFQVQVGMGNSVLANPAEKLVCPKIAKAFGQTTFKVDLLRSQTVTDSEDKFFVYDISVKGGALKNRGNVYYDEVALALYNDICTRMNCTPFRGPHFAGLGAMTPPPSAFHDQHPDLLGMETRPPSRSAQLSNAALSHVGEDGLSESATRRISSKSGHQELLCVWCLVRHGDRTPKRKLKLKVPCDDPYTAGWLLGWLQGGESEDTLSEFFGKQRENSKVVELRVTQQLQRLFLVLKECDKTHKRNSRKESKNFEKEAGASEEKNPGPKEKQKDPIEPLSCSDDVSVLQSGIKVLDSFLRTTSESPLLHAKVEVQSKNIKVTLKWGGELTHVGKKQAYDLGEHFRAEHFPFDDASHLHATLRHDVKVYASAEPRCRQTAGSFTKGFLSLSGPLPQIIVSFVRTDGLGRLTDAPFKHTPVYGEIKEIGRDLSTCAPDALVADPNLYVRAHEAMEEIIAKYETVAKAVAKLIDIIDVFAKQLTQRTDTLSNLETTVLMSLRWHDLGANLGEDHGTVGHCLDAAIYDVRHNLALIKDDAVRQTLLEVKNLALKLSEIISPVEFGRTLSEKAKIGAHFVSPLIRKLRFDLRVASGMNLGKEEEVLEKHNELYDGSHGWKPIRTRLYFAHNSHIQTLVNCFRFGGELCDEKKGLDEVQFPADLDQLGYCSHLTVKLWRIGTNDIAQIFLSVGDGGDGGEEKREQSVGCGACGGERPENVLPAGPSLRAVPRAGTESPEKVNCSMLLGEVPLHELDKFFSQVIEDA